MIELQGEAGVALLELVPIPVQTESKPVRKGLENHKQLGGVLERARATVVLVSLPDRGLAAHAPLLRLEPDAQNEGGSENKYEQSEQKSPKVSKSEQNRTARAPRGAAPVDRSLHQKKRRRGCQLDRSAGQSAVQGFGERKGEAGRESEGCPRTVDAHLPQHVVG